MADELQEPKLIDTKEAKSVYCNSAAMSMSFNDIRIYLSEVVPTGVVANPAGKGEFGLKGPEFQQKVALVMSPEFTRTLANVLAQAVTQYEQVFGTLRPEPTQEHLMESLKKFRPQ